MTVGDNMTAHLSSLKH